MKAILCTTTIVLAVLMGTNLALANEGVIRIPLKTFVKPPGDLINQKNEILSYAQLAKRYKKHNDLSRLSPAENKYWQNTENASLDPNRTAVDQQTLAQMPSQNETVIFDDYLGAVRELGIFSIYIKPEKNPNVRYGLTLGQAVNASVMRSALLRKAGYYQESLKYVKDLTVKFPSTEKMNEFLDRAFCETDPTEESLDCLFDSVEKDRYVTDINPQANTLKIHSVYIEKFNADVPALYDGVTPAQDSADLMKASESRAFRALAVPFVMSDMGVSINRFARQPVQVRQGWAVMNYHSSVYFDMITSHDDMKWGLNQYSQLSDQDWTEIVDAGQFPQCTRRLIKSLILHRYKNMVATFFSTEEANRRTSNLNIEEIRSIETECVSEGRVTSKFLEGYPQKISYGPNKSPFETADLLRYMKVASQSAAIQTALGQLGKKIQKQEITDMKINGVEVGPKGFRYLINATGYAAGLSFNANRFVSTGTFYGSDAPVQRIDTVSIAGGLGVFNILEGLNGVRRNFGANASYVRSFTHVTPIMAMKEADKGWSQLFVPTALKKLTRPLKDGNLSEFLAGMKVGEVFTITDSIQAGVDVSWTSGLDSLFGFVNGLSASIGFDANRQIVLRQIQFNKTKDGLQVYIRDVDSHMRDEDGNKKKNHKQTTSVYGVTFDLNYFINIMKFRYQRTQAKLHTDAFLIRYNVDLLKDFENLDVDMTPEIEAEIERLEVIGKKASSTLRSLLVQSNVEPLYENFKSQQFEIDHNFKINETTLKLFWHRAATMYMEHDVKVLKTSLPPAVDGAVVKNQAVNVFVTRRGELRGQDKFGFGLDILNYKLGEKFGDKAPVYNIQSQNPSQMPFGKAEWRVIRTDSEVTSGGREGQLPTVSIIQHVWSGWSLKRKEMVEILNKLKEKVKGVRIADFPLIPDGALSHVDKVDFFKVTSNLSLMPEAIQEVKNLLLSPEAKGQPVERAQFVSRMFQKLSEVGGKARAEDKALVDKLILILGNGDAALGRAQYMAECQAIKQKQNGGEYQQFTTAWYKGTNYECLAPWIEKLIDLSRKFPENDLKEQNRWTTEVLFVLDEQIPLAYILNYLGKDKFLYYVEVVGFRQGDEDGDAGMYLSNVYGEPAKAAPYANGLLGILSQKSYISPVELEKQGSF